MPTPRLIDLADLHFALSNSQLKTAKCKVQNEDASPPVWRFPFWSFLFAMAALAIVAAMLCSLASGAEGLDSIVRVRVDGRVTPEGRETSYGTGTVVRYEGQPAVLTCDHVLRERSSDTAVSVRLRDGRVIRGVVWATDAAYDLALIGTPEMPADVLPVNLAQEPLRQGEQATLYGYGPDGRLIGQRAAVKGYLISGRVPKYRTVAVAAASRDGDSGGPILNDAGELAGVLWGSDDVVKETVGSYTGVLQRGYVAWGAHISAGQCPTCPGGSFCPPGRQPPQVYQWQPPAPLAPIAIGPPVRPANAPPSTACDPAALVPIPPRPVPIAEPAAPAPSPQPAADLATQFRELREAIAKIPAGPPGPPGKDGADGKPGPQGPPGPACTVNVQQIAAQVLQEAGGELDPMIRAKVDAAIRERLPIAFQIVPRNPHSARKP